MPQPMCRSRPKLLHARREPVLRLAPSASAVHEAAADEPVIEFDRKAYRQAGKLGRRCVSHAGRVASAGHRQTPHRTAQAEEGGQCVTEHRTVARSPRSHEAAGGRVAQRSARRAHARRHHRGSGGQVHQGPGLALGRTIHLSGPPRPKAEGGARSIDPGAIPPRADSPRHCQASSHQRQPGSASHCAVCGRRRCACWCRWRCAALRWKGHKPQSTMQSLWNN